MRSDGVYLDDILTAIGNIEEYTEGMPYSDFRANVPVQNTVIRNFEIIGEAVKKLPAELKAKETGIRWGDLAGFRDVLMHQYFNVNLQIVWKATKEDLPELKLAVQRIKKSL
ncbi:MAG: DUF86 domain-containing protein [Candidatus Marsarchaeota archaeon]|nr:DUF86 domain-containing protein [Candidatus Marsarchaeota archaeon]